MYNDSSLLLSEETLYVMKLFAARLKDNSLSLGEHAFPKEMVPFSYGVNNGPFHSDNRVAEHQIISYLIYIKEMSACLSVCAIILAKHMGGFFSWHDDRF